MPDVIRHIPISENKLEDNSVSYVELPISICEVCAADGTKYYVTLASPDAAFNRGLAPEEIVGVLLMPPKGGERITPDNFARNKAFVDFMHDTISTCAHTLSELAASAKRQGEGWIYILDGRTPTPNGTVPPEDIIGAFQVKDGQLVPASYQRNSNHTILSERGFVRLDGELMERLLAALSRLGARGR
jgi:hypothetical protein